MQRIKYKKNRDKLESRIFDIYGKQIKVQIQTIENGFYIEITRLYNWKIETFELKSLQNAKRKIRKILKEKFEVNLHNEIRSKICF